jgi:hypothetical protein
MHVEHLGVCRIGTNRMKKSNKRYIVHQLFIMYKNYGLNP